MNRKKNVALVLIITILLSSVSSLAATVTDQYYEAARGNVRVFRSRNFRRERIPIAELNKGEIVRLVRLSGNRAEIEIDGEVSGWVLYSDLARLSQKRNIMMNELQILSGLKEIEPVFIILDGDEPGERKVKYIERSFMTPEFLVNFSKDEFERMIELHYIVLNKK